MFSEISWDGDSGGGGGRFFYRFKGGARPKKSENHCSSSLFNKETELFCKWSQPGIMHLRDEGIAS